MSSTFSSRVPYDRPPSQSDSVVDSRTVHRVGTLAKLNQIPGGSDEARPSRYCHRREHEKWRTPERARFGSSSRGLDEPPGWGGFVGRCLSGQKSVIEVIAPRESPAPLVGSIDGLAPSPKINKKTNEEGRGTAMEEGCWLRKQAGTFDQINHGLDQWRAVDFVHLGWGFPRFFFCSSFSWSTRQVMQAQAVDARCAVRSSRWTRVSPP